MLQAFCASFGRLLEIKQYFGIPTKDDGNRFYAPGYLLKNFEVSCYCLTLAVIFIQGDWPAIKFEGIFRGLQVSCGSTDESREEV